VTAGDRRGDDAGWRPVDDASSPVPPGGPTPPLAEKPPPPPPPEAPRRPVPPPPRSPGPAAGGDGDGRSVSAKVVLLIALGVLVLAVGAALVVAAATSSSDADDEAAVEAPGDETDDRDDAAAEDDLASDLDLDAPPGRDEALGRLLVDVDASERAMIGFQEEVGEALEGFGAVDPEQVVDELRDAAREGGSGLAEVRPSLVAELGHPAADEVRSVYLTHHDVWADYLEAVEEDPTLLASEGEGARWTLLINSSAEAFERALREELDADLDDEVRELGEEILARGFDRSDVRPDA
jgi:hypothetical protein